MSQNDIVVAIILFVVSIGASNIGSMSSIRGAWHAQNIYHKCVMPSVGKVTMPPMYLGLVLGIGVYYTLVKLLLSTSLLSIVIAAIVSVIVSFRWARQRGTRIYSENVLREGFPV